VVSPKEISIKQVLDSTMQAAKTLSSLNPTKNQHEFEHYRLMTDIRVHYLQYEEIEKTANSASFDTREIPKILTQLEDLMATGNELDKRFIDMNKDYLYPAELAEENELRNVKVRLLYQRLSRKR
jgi:hexosaminidase